MPAPNRYSPYKLLKHPDGVKIKRLPPWAGVAAMAVGGRRALEHTSFF